MWRLVIAAAMLSGSVGCDDTKDEAVPFLGPPFLASRAPIQHDLSPLILRATLRTAMTGTSQPYVELSPEEVTLIETCLDEKVAPPTLP